MGPEIGILAEIASLQIEYIYLAKVTGRKQYFQRVRHAYFTWPLTDTLLGGCGVQDSCSSRSA